MVDNFAFLVYIIHLPWRSVYLVAQGSMVLVLKQQRIRIKDSMLGPRHDLPPSSSYSIGPRPAGAPIAEFQSIH